VKTYLAQIKTFFHPIRHVLYFLFLLFAVHFLYLLWKDVLVYFPLEGLVNWLFDSMAQVALKQSVWLINALGFEVEAVGARIHVGPEKLFVTVTPECTTLKQWVHWVVIIIFFPGPWKHKLWYIPSGILVIHLTNIVRISGLAILRLPFPEVSHFNFFHDYIFKTLFYVVIFLMWYLWYEKFTLKGCGVIGD